MINTNGFILINGSSRWTVVILNINDVFLTRKYTCGVSRICRSLSVYHFKSKLDDPRMTLNKILMQFKQRKNKELHCLCIMGDLSISLLFYILDLNIYHLSFKIFHFYNNHYLAPYCDVVQCSDYLEFTGDWLLN